MNSQKIEDQISIRLVEQCSDGAMLAVGNADSAMTKLFREVLVDIESRTCENCKYLRGKDKEAECVKGYLPDNLYEDDFGCNKFIRKDK